MYSLQAKVPDGYAVAPHWHPKAENMVVLSGTVYMGYGDKLDKDKGHAMPAGSFMRVNAHVHHYAWAQGETVMQIWGVGPFTLHYINPAADPRHKPSQ